MKGYYDKHFFGAVSVGERGQVVIPKDAREEFGIRPGDKLIVLGRPGGALVLVRAQAMRDFAKNILKSI